VGTADTEHGPAKTGDDGTDEGGGILEKRTLGVARATGHPKTPAAAAEFDARTDRHGPWPWLATTATAIKMRHLPVISIYSYVGGRHI